MGVFEYVIKALHTEGEMRVDFEPINESGERIPLIIGDTHCVELFGRFYAPLKGNLFPSIIDQNGVLKKLRVKSGGYKWGYELQGLEKIKEIMDKLEELKTWKAYEAVEDYNRLKTKLEKLEKENELLRAQVNLLRK